MSSPAEERISWATVVGLALGPAVALGFARFAYGLVLPAMRDDLDWSFAQAGAINTANAVGYLVGAIVAAGISRRRGPRAAFRDGLLVTGVAVLACMSTGALGAQMALRFLAGVSGAVVFIVGAALASGLARGDRGPMVIGVYLGGAATGVVVSGLVVPLMLEEHWQLAWMALGGLSIAACGAALSAAARAPVPADPPTLDAPGWRAGPIVPAMVSYGLFGAGYIAYATFIVAYLREQGAETAEVAAFWVVLGATSLASVFTWGGVLTRMRSGRGLALTIGVTAAGAGLPLLSESSAMSFASAALFGCAFLAVPTAATAFGRSAHPQHHWTAAIAALTIAFAFGQCLGPVVAGVLSDGEAGIRSGLVLSVAILVAGALVALVQPHREPAGG